MNPLRQRTQAIAQALTARLTADQLAELRHDLTEHWTDADLIATNAPGGADVMLYALEDACAIATENDATRGTAPNTHASPGCACGTNEAGQRYRDPICRPSSTLPAEHPQSRTRLPSDVDQGPETPTEEQRLDRGDLVERSPARRRFSGRQLRERRDAAGLSREQLARRTDRSVFSIVAYERDRAVPSVTTLCALADALAVPIDRLFAEVAVSVDVA